MKFLQNLGAIRPRTVPGSTFRDAGQVEDAEVYSYGARGGRVRLKAAATSAVDRRPSDASEIAARLRTSSPDQAAPTDSAQAAQPQLDSPAPRSGPSDPSTDISGTADISGFVGACLVDSDSGLMLAAEGGESIDLEAAAALNTQVVRAEHQVIEALGLDDHVEDILITMTRQLHFIRPLEASPSMFLYVCLDKKGANLGMARMQVNKIEGGLKL